MMITGIKSRPVYDTLVPMTGGRTHVIAGQGSGGVAIARLASEMTPQQRAATTVIYSTASFSGHDHQGAVRASGVSRVDVVDSNAAAIQALDDVLASATMGLRLYLAGSESFIGTAMQVARVYDLGPDEILREHAGSLTRRVWCAHCDHYTEDVTRRLFVCSGCGLTLVVRDHYSSRLAAFQGVKADGEVPGESR